MRKYKLWTLLGTALVLSLLVGACAPKPTPAPLPAPTPVPKPALVPAPTPPVKPSPISTLTAIPSEIMVSHIGFVGAEHDVVELTELGAKWDRPHPGPFIWGRIERRKGTYDWREVDGYVRGIQQNNFATVATIWPFANGDQANWGKPSSANLIFQREMGRGRRKPYNMDAYKRFVSALVERYDGDGEDDMPELKFPIKYWEASTLISPTSIP